MEKHQKNQLLLCFSTTMIAIQLTSAVDFLFNGFGPSDVSSYLNATIESRVLTLTGCGSAIYPSKIPTKHPNSSLVIPFSTSFIFAIVPHQGVTNFLNSVIFGFVPPREEIGCSYSVPGFGVYFHVSSTENNKDINMGINFNSSYFVRDPAGFWPDDGRERLKLRSRSNYQSWIDYADGVFNVTMVPAGTKRPSRPLISFPLNLSVVFQDEMYVVISNRGYFSVSNKILGWSFSNTNFSFSERLITGGLPDFEFQKTPIHKTKYFIAGLISFGVLLFAIVACFLIKRNRRVSKKMEETENWELEYWPHSFSYRAIEKATNNFSEENVIGVGGNGKVYKGVFSGGSEVAVKRISRESNEGIKAFSAEISSLGRLKHRNLVGLRGWCKKDKGSLILVYDYMENGSLDKRMFECDESKMLNIEDRLRILKQVAHGVMYLHHGWKSKVLHRDIKAGNVLLDKEMNARLGDFGLAQIHGQDMVDGATHVIGTVGYLAPEIVRHGRASTKTDVFSYGVLNLEVICGRRPIEQGKPLLVEWLWELLRKGELLDGVDPRLRANNNGEFDEEKVGKMLQLGLLCAHPDPSVRPTMRQVVKLFEEKNEEVDHEPEGEDMYILERIKNREILCSSVSISWSNSMGFGR